MGSKQESDTDTGRMVHCRRPGTNRIDTPYVLLHWYDTQTSSLDWASVQDAVEAGKPAECTSVGFLLENNPDWVTIAQTMSCDGPLNFDETRDVITIPKSCIHMVQVLIRGGTGWETVEGRDTPNGTSETGATGDHAVSAANPSQ